MLRRGTCPHSRTSLITSCNGYERALEFELTPEIELRERFVPRQIYGDYLRSIVQHHLQSPGEVTPA